MAEKTMHTPTEAFSDRRVILVKWQGDRCARYWDESSAGYEQAEDGPTHLFVGARAPDEKLHRLADRFGYTFEELKAFRDGNEQPTSTIKGAQHG